MDESLTESSAHPVPLSRDCRKGLPTDRLCRAYQQVDKPAPRLTGVGGAAFRPENSQGTGSRGACRFQLAAAGDEVRSSSRMPPPVMHLVLPGQPVTEELLVVAFLHVMGLQPHPRHMDRVAVRGEPPVGLEDVGAD